MYLLRPTSSSTTQCYGVQCSHLGPDLHASPPSYSVHWTTIITSMGLFDNHHPLRRTEYSRDSPIGKQRSLRSTSIKLVPALVSNGFVAEKLRHLLRNTPVRNDLIPDSPFGHQKLIYGVLCAILGRGEKPCIWILSWLWRGIGMQFAQGTHCGEDSHSRAMVLRTRYGIQ